MSIGESQSSADEPAGGTRLSTFIRKNHSAILDMWEASMRVLPVARDLDRMSLLDHLPGILDRIGEVADALERGRAPGPSDDVDQHASERLDRGFDLSQVVIEFAFVRDCIMTLGDGANELDYGGVRALNRAIDEAVSASIQRYTRVRDRTVHDLDRIAIVSLESTCLDDLLRRLIGVLMGTLRAVDTAVIFVRDGDALVPRAALGLDLDVEAGRRARVGDGSFEGLVAQTGKPLVQTAIAPVDLRSAVLRGRSPVAVYTVPLIDGGSTIGVAQMSSRTTGEFSKEELNLFSMMAARATAAIYQHGLRETADWRAAELAAVIESMPAAVYIADEKGVTRCNKAALEMMGAEDVSTLRETPSLATRLHARDAATDEPIPPEEDPFTFALRATPLTRDIKVRHLKTQRDLVVRSLAAPVLRDNDVVGAVSVNIDVSEHVRLENELRGSVHLREEILTVVSHDLRNPLAAIHMAAQILRQGCGERLQRHAATIDRSAVRMEHLISDLLDMANIELGHLSLAPAAEEPTALMDEVVQHHEALAREKGVDLVFRGCPSLEGTQLYCDRDRVLQVFGNLIGNAIKFSRPGDEIDVSAKRAGDRAEFVVADTGPGIPAADLPHIFDPHWSATRHAKLGSGLGLHISKGIVEAHGGHLEVESNYGKGALFRFTLPLVSATPS